MIITVSVRSISQNSGIAELMYEMPSKFKVGVIHELPLP
jgi:hypothetical protein